MTRTSDGFTTQEFKTHLPTSVAQVTNTVWMFDPFFKTDLTWEDTRIGLEETSECLHVIVLSLSQSPIVLCPSPSLVIKSVVHVEVTGVL